MLERKEESIHLSELSSNQVGVIASFSEALDPNTVQRLNDLGLHVDRNIQCLRRLPFGGPLSIAVDGLVLALDNTVAKHIFVKSTN